jgi:uncharacterized protein
MHSLIVPAIDRTLGALSNILTKADEHCAAKNIKPEALLNFRLFPDMLPFIKQVQLACDFAARGCARLASVDVPSFADTETSFAELQDRIKAARAYIASLPVSAFDDAATKVITFSAGQRDMTMPGSAFFASFAMPQMHFHCTTAYNILRHNGVEVGKRDYMGA